MKMPTNWTLSGQATFIVFDISLFNTTNDLKSNPFEDGRNNEYHGGAARKDLLHVLDGPIMMIKAKKIKKVMQRFVQATWAESSSRNSKIPFAFDLS